MSFRELSDRKAVLSAIGEYDELGQDAFLHKYGFGRARSYFLLYKSNRYDSKAIVGVAHKHQFGTLLASTEFSGGLATVVPKLEGLGFRVIAEDITEASTSLPEEVAESMWEGGKKSVIVNAYERSPEARAACIEIHGSSCAICGFDFGREFGMQFHGYIHVHHKVPIAKIESRYEINPAEDLVPVCPNCHAVIHYGNKTRSVEEVKALLEGK